MKNFLYKANKRVDWFRGKQLGEESYSRSNIIINIVLVAVIAAISSILFIGSVGAGFFVSLVDDQEALNEEEMRAEIYDYEQASDMYFAGGESLGNVPADIERKQVPLEDISDNLVDAIIATEDEDFYDHDGIVPTALLRATYQEISNAGTQTGGSTLTQQVIKNQILTNEVSFERKAKEILLALRLEGYLSKEEILEAYLNLVPFGRNANGLNIAGAQSAAEGVFGVDASELNIAQAAFIAGMPQNPYGYTPFENNGTVKDEFEAGINRKNRVLNDMNEKGYISEEEYEEAMAYDIEENLAEPSDTVTDEYPYITSEVQREASTVLREQMLEEDDVDLDAMDEEEREQTLEQYTADAREDLAIGGYDIHITVDKSIYDGMQESIESSTWFGPDRTNGDITEQEEVGAMMINNQTGAIISFVGGRDYETQNLNHATQTFRQNGSTMKPLLSYGPLLDSGELHPGSTVADVPTDYTTGTEINNAGSDFEGFIPVREALQRSQNIPAVRSFWELEQEEAKDHLESLGFTRLSEEEPVESTALGGLENGVTVSQNTNAFSTFANEGQYHESYMVERIEKKNDGEVTYEHETEETEIFSPQTSYLMVDMLRDVLESPGTASQLSSYLDVDGDWAGKTGTTTDQVDAWFVGMNPEVTMGIWLGYDNREQQNQLESPYNGYSYSERTQNIWADLMNAANEANPDAVNTDSTFEEPDGIVEQEICGLSGLLVSPMCEEAGLAVTDLMNEEFVPTEEDDSLQEGDLVEIDGSTYTAYDETPDDFTLSGIIMDEDYFEDIDNPAEYFPEDIGDITVDREAPDNERDPSTVSGVSGSGDELTWSEHPDDDIVGYRIYEGSSVEDTVVGKDNTSASVGSGTFTVRAVDTRGRESSNSASTDISSGTTETENDDESSNDESSEDESTESSPSNTPDEGSGESEDSSEESPSTTEDETNSTEQESTEESPAEENNDENNSPNEEDSGSSDGSNEEENSSENGGSEEQTPSDNNTAPPAEEDSSPEPAEEPETPEEPEEPAPEPEETPEEPQEEVPVEEPADTNGSGSETDDSSGSETPSEESSGTSTESEEENRFSRQRLFSGKSGRRGRN
ncbi:transglycosylase domain-containing protein [Sinobaca sp. H24]|uniref:transglycosylase domain-containing protein n=1 Tax=Sinobaca sp. H24 TaxID=2923376 RepID=UPI00207A6928|nr:transglycosylase domain-containing protein [Sinobaca sp. H24]